MKIYHINCPLCGKELFKTTPIEYMEVECSECFGKLNIVMVGNKLVVEEYAGSRGTRNVVGKRMRKNKERILDSAKEEVGDVVLCV